MRLIDADALKGLPFHRLIHTDFGDTSVSFEEIDNAPTVEPDESVIQEVLNKRCMTAVANEYLIALHGKRPQGEWTYTIPDINSIGFWYCNQCNFIKDAWMHYRFCPNCGAYMRGKDNG